MNRDPASVSIRRMAPDDVQWAMQLALSSPLAPHWTVDAWRTAIHPEATPQRIALVAEIQMTSGREIAVESRVALAVASLVQPEAELETIVVIPSVQRQGVGRAIFIALADELKAANVTEVTLEVRGSNHQALALYAALGFARTRRRVGYYTDPKEDAAIMRLRLS